jgi:low temperature requirement protein LtrA
VSEHEVAVEQAVTPFELFFDLVFVFALTQVTVMLGDDPSWHGLARAVLLLGTLWWAWAGYAWLTNTLDSDQDGVLAALLAAMAALFIAALVVPTAFSSHALLFGMAFLLVNLMHLTLLRTGRARRSRPPPRCVTDGAVGACWGFSNPHCGLRFG